jgi:pimeloyl-ACP methyl ester carboxylesterase
MWPRSAAATQPGLSPDDLCAVTARTLVLTGGDDLVTLDHTLALYRALPAAEPAVLPDASHLLLMEHGGAVRDMVLKFLTTNAAPAYMPIARAGLRGAGGRSA